MARLVPFAYGFRPFFLAAGWYAIIGLGTWLLVYETGAAPFGALPAVLWHAHEMLFGFVAAAIAGFMLTAVPSWTGSRGYAGRPLVLLFCLWLAGRVAMAAAGVLPLPLVAIAELAFLPALAITLVPALFRSTNRNRPLVAVIFALWATDATFVYALVESDVLLASRAVRIALDIVLLLVTVIGGRIVPAFTAAGLRRRGVEVTVRPYPIVERLAIGGMVGVVLIDIAAPNHWTAAVVAGIAALAHAIRMTGWATLRTFRDPIVWVLHVAYAWLPVGLFLKAIFLLTGAGWAAHWLHALGAGAAATMIVAVMTRASLGHTGRLLVAAKPVAWAYALLFAAAAVRVFGPRVLPLGYLDVIVGAGALWIAAFLLYAWAYTPILLQPRVDGKPG